MKEILFLTPIFKEMIWGGTRLKDIFGYELQCNNIGECWAISAHENGSCEVAKGSFKGKTLKYLWDNHRYLFGDAKGNSFPLLVKIIDAKQDLSIQVHPSDNYAKKYENVSYGKTECWYILDCDADATIIIGHNAKTRADLVDMIENKKWNELIREIPVRKGDFFQINPGCIHAIKGGTMILETQQNSDITYRVYDYDRLQNGKPRELHIKKALDVITIPFEDCVQSPKKSVFSNYTREVFIRSPYYTVEKFSIKKSLTIDQCHNFMNVSVIDGGGLVDDNPIKKGSHFIIPYEYGKVVFDGQMDLIISYV